MSTKTRPKATVVMPTCPHCQQGSKPIKERGAYHTFEHDGRLVKLFHVRCSSCEGRFTLREEWPICADPAGIPGGSV